MYDAGANSNVIVATYPGRGTGDTVYQTATGHHFEVMGSCGRLPRGYRWADSMYHSNVYECPIKIDALGPPSKPRYTPLASKKKPWQNKAVSMRTPFFVSRPEFHARSNPR